MISACDYLPMLLAQFAVLLRRHADKLAEGVIKAAAGSESGGQRNIGNGFIGTAEQYADMIDPHCRNILLQGELHYALESPHHVVDVGLHVFRGVVDGECLIVAVGNKAQHLANVKLGVPRHAVFMGPRCFIDQGRLSTGKTKSFEHQTNFANDELANLFVWVIQFLLPALNLKGARLLRRQRFDNYPMGNMIDQFTIQRLGEERAHR